jgi:GNAT superfamily N-acetyltransferase
MFAYIQVRRTFDLKIRNSVIIKLANGSYLRFCSHKDNGIDISSVYVMEENQNKGDGTLLMNFLLNSILTSLEQFPLIILECTGRSGYGNKLINSNIQSQIKFFRKFGFRVDRTNSNYPHYVKMVFDLKNLVSQENNI